ncbi:hypothetical protein BU25DRAFT_458754 [Macroventuria anomochaeta]|uniref:Uncharacterized protein n=1 Tax=Macroventuria anomochaeta TaxID=301207 RepID=A0ACB6RZI8_9PLEO|nr:uncharacterized protein BU25DRAFT_458754 [Macroventuria anomochaeta]KAF2627426.1 hypothetical protein BU25DRAFT_458754 [Macroventuria anomochaeta]
MSQSPNNLPPLRFYNLPTLPTPQPNIDLATSNHPIHYRPSRSSQVPGQNSQVSDGSVVRQRPGLPQQQPVLANPPTRPYTPYTPLTAMFPPPRATYAYSPTQQFSFDDQAIRTRIIHIVAQKLSNAHPDNIALLVMHIARSLVRMKRIGELGPRGVTSAEDVFLGVGYEGTSCYMGLMVNAPGAGAVRTFFRGDVRQMGDVDKMSPEVRMKVLEVGFVSALMRQYDQIRDVKLAQGRW